MAKMKLGKVQTNVVTFKTSEDYKKWVDHRNEIKAPIKVVNVLERDKEIVVTYEGKSVAFI